MKLNIILIVQIQSIKTQSPSSKFSLKEEAYITNIIYCSDIIDFEAQNKPESQIVQSIEQLEKRTIAVDRFIDIMEQHTDEEIVSQLECISRSLLKQISSLTPSEVKLTFRNFSDRLLQLFEQSALKKARFLVALLRFDSERLIPKAHLEPELAIRWLSILDPSLHWIVQVSRKSNSELYHRILQIDPELIAQKSDLIQEVVSELNRTMNRQQKDFLFKLLTRSFVKRSELVELISDKLIYLCSQLPIDSNLELSVSFLATLQHSIDSTDIAKEIAKKLEKVCLRDKEFDSDEQLEKGLKLFFDKTLPPVAELIPLLALEKWNDSLMRALLAMSCQNLLQGIFKNAHLCLFDHVGLDALFRASPSLIYSISATELSDKAILDGSGALRRVSNSWLTMIPPISKHNRQTRRLPLSSTSRHICFAIVFTLLLTDICFQVTLKPVDIRTVDWKRVRLFLVGDSGAGKSSFLRWLKGDPVLEQHQPTFTEEIETIDLQDWKPAHYDNLHSQIAMKRGMDITLNIWDCGGNPVYYNILHFFFTPMALYLLVVDLSLDEFETTVIERVEYWIRTIRHYDPKQVSILTV